MQCHILISISISLSLSLSIYIWIVAPCRNTLFVVGNKCATKLS